MEPATIFTPTPAVARTVKVAWDTRDILYSYIRNVIVVHQSIRAIQKEFRSLGGACSKAQGVITDLSGKDGVDLSVGNEQL